TSFIDTGLTGGQTYYYEVSAVSSSGQSGSSSEVSAIPTSAPTLPPPANLAAAGVSTSQINLTWTNNAANATAYDIKRSPDGTTWTVIVSNLASATSSYANTSLTAGTSY